MCSATTSSAPPAAKGLPERTVIFRHALRNAALPLVTVMGLELGGPAHRRGHHGNGVRVAGRRTAGAGCVRGRDYPVVQASVLFIATIFVLINFLVDSSYAFLDPRVARRNDAEPRSPQGDARGNH